MLWPMMLLLLVGTSCQSTKETSPKNQYVQGEDRPLVDSKYSLKADRERLEELRQQIPPETQAQNDELALLDQLFSDPKKNASEIKNKFDQSVRKVRERFDRDARKERESFTKTERKNRDEFLKNSKKQRELFLKTKRSSEERKDFLSEQDQKRQAYFSDERERRNDFESDMRERRKSFDDSIREKQSEFMQRWRAFKDSQKISGSEL